MRKRIVKKTIYSNILKPGRFIKRTLIFSSVVSILIGILALLGYIPGLRFLGSGSMGPDYYPMAPSTAISFLLLSIIMIIYILGFLRSRARFFVTLIPVVVSIYGFIKLIEYYAKVGVSFEESIINIPGEIGGIPIGFMSPPTGALFFISGIVIILLIFQATGKKYTNFIGHLMGVLGSVVVLGGLTFIMSYLYGQPFLYNPGNIAPMALTTAIAFLFLGIALVNTTGKDYFPLIFFTGTSTRCRLLRIFVPLVVLIVLVQDILSKLIQNVFVINDAIIMGLWIICFVLIDGFSIFRF